MKDGWEGSIEPGVGCGELQESDAGVQRVVSLAGWVHRRRDLGQLIFIELRDHTGIVQIVFDPSLHAEAHQAAEQLRNEFVVAIQGKVVFREAPNAKIPGGTIEVQGASLILHNRAEVPFPVDGSQEISEEARLRYRYVDLRRPEMQNNLRMRHRLSRAARAALDDQSFMEVETPMLTRSTPEGARDYLVPSRVHEGHFYALPQSPQLFKQLLMVAGYHRYYQFARCFRDEDLRADRQPEFTQIDIEMAFIEQNTVYELIEPLIARLFTEIGVELKRPFPRMPYKEAMERFGSDKPDLRFGLEISDPGDSVENTGFVVFDSVLEKGGVVRGIVVPGAAATSSRKTFDRWTEAARKSGAGGLIWIKWDAAGKLTSPAMKALGEDRCRRIVESLGGDAGDVVLLVADRLTMVQRVLGSLRLLLAEELSLIDPDRWEVVWVEEFPLLERDEEAGRWISPHHPFTAPRWDQVDRLDDDPGSVTSQAYDLVLNGVELGGGSIRIHRLDVQQKVFRALGIDDAEAEEKFGFLLKALGSGAPPHGGIALGFDRICAMLCGCSSIRDVIAFPKTTSASCLMTGSPARVDLAQLRDLHLRRNSDPRPDEEKPIL